MDPVKLLLRQHRQHAAVAVALLDAADRHLQRTSSRDPGTLQSNAWDQMRRVGVHELYPMASGTGRFTPDQRYNPRRRQRVRTWAA